VSGARAGGAMSRATDARGASDIREACPRSGDATASAVPAPAQSVTGHSAAAGAPVQQSVPLAAATAAQGAPSAEDRAPAGNAAASVTASKMASVFRIRQAG